MSGRPWNKVVDSRDEQRRKKRQAVLEAGAFLFNENGFERTSLDDLARKLGVTKRTLYYYVQSKEEILMECVRQGMEFLETIIQSSEQEARAPLEQISLIITEYVRQVSTDFGAALVLTRENLLLDETRRTLRQTKSRLDRLMRDAISQGIASGDIAPCDPKLVSAAIFGALNWVPYWNRKAEPVPAEEIAKQFKQTFLHGLVRADGEQLPRTSSD